MTYEKLMQKHWWDYIAVACVGLIMIINIFVAAFAAIWSQTPVTYPGQSYLTLANGTRVIVQGTGNGTFSFIKNVQ